MGPPAPLRRLWSLLGFGYWVVCERTNNAYVGAAAYGSFSRDMEPGLGANLEIG